MPLGSRVAPHLGMHRLRLDEHPVQQTHCTTCGAHKPVLAVSVVDDVVVTELGALNQCEDGRLFLAKQYGPVGTGPQ